MGLNSSSLKSETLDRTHTFELTTLDDDNLSIRKANLNEILLKDLPIDDLSLKTHNSIMNGIRMIENNRYPGYEYVTKPKYYVEANCLKRIVSKKKIRYRDSEFDLDLVYITKRIIAMGFPAFGLESLYRNSAEDVANFLDKYHRGHSKIYNLCSEHKRNYDTSFFYSKGIDVAYFPFKDHTPCRVKMIFEFCFDVYLYMLKHPKNIAAIHCKAGKGRTGLMICSYLLFIQASKDIVEALHLYGSRRTKNSKGLTIAGQIRYVQYFQKSLSEKCGPKYTNSIMDYVKDPAETLRKLVPTSKKSVKVFNIGPFDFKAGFGFYIEDFDGRIKAIYNVPELMKNKNNSTIILDDKMDIEILEENKKFIYQMVFKNSEFELEDDLKLTIKLKRVSLVCWFNIGYLRTFEKLQNLNSGYYNGFMFDPQGRIISKRMRYFDYAEKIEEERFFFDEFQSYDFDKWHKKKLEGKLPDNFSFFIGCYDYISKHTISSINQA